MHIERFAPSPTGLLHLGHAYSAWCAWSEARAAGGRFLLRMEDLDTSRVRAPFYDGVERDLRWLGLDWDGDVLRQSDRLAVYSSALDRLGDAGLTYRCYCSRRDIADAISAPQEGAIGPDGPVYPGTCRNAPADRDKPHAIRLNMAAAMSSFPGPQVLAFTEIGTGPASQTGEQLLDHAHMVARVGDIVLRRRDGAFAYHLAVVVDDAHQGTTHVTRGQDLFEATVIHRLLQALLDLPTPVYRHHLLVRDEHGKRLAKRDDSRAVEAYRHSGMSPDAVLDLARSRAAPAICLRPL